MDRKISKKRLEENDTILTKEKVVEHLRRYRGFSKILNICEGSDFVDVTVLRGDDPITYRVRLIGGDYLVAVK